MRGNRAYAVLVYGDYRSIPARAGEPKWIILVSGIDLGLSPRVRGNLLGYKTIKPIKGSIPARAGEPGFVYSEILPEQVYPRACGGTCFVPSLYPQTTGLSPRVRGNRPLEWQRSSFLRSIPARAGEPIKYDERTAVNRVYPRACGGTS